jgi:acyl transferase domain-containing protein
MRHIVGRKRLVVSYINSPSTVIISGPETDLEVLVSMISRDVIAQKLRVKLGYHSPQMRLISARYSEMLGNLDPGSPSGSQKPLMVSSVTGDVVDHETVCSGAYFG